MLPLLVVLITGSSPKELIDKDSRIQGVKGSSENNRKTNIYRKTPDSWNRFFIQTYAEKTEVFMSFVSSRLHSLEPLTP